MGRSFEDLKAWQLARELRKAVYECAKRFPREERFRLTDQIKRAAISVTANIAEGYGRFHCQENIQFCRTARGSVNEVIDHLYTALDSGYLPEDMFRRLYEQAREVEKVINGYIKYLLRRKG